MDNNPNCERYIHEGVTHFLPKSTDKRSFCGLEGVSPEGTIYKECPKAERRLPARLSTFQWKARMPGQSNRMLPGLYDSPQLAAIARKLYSTE